MKTVTKHVTNFRDKYNDVAYTIFRVLIGVLFMFHGAQKLFGAYSTQPTPPLVSMMGLAGIIEFFGGILIVVGLFTSVIALLSAIEMIVAYFIAHFALNNIVPLVNHGELALLYFAAFLYIAFEGAGKYSLSRVLFKS